MNEMFCFYTVKVAFNSILNTKRVEKLLALLVSIALISGCQKSVEQEVALVSDNEIEVVDDQNGYTVAELEVLLEDAEDHPDPDIDLYEIKEVLDEIYENDDRRDFNLIIDKLVKDNVGGVAAIFSVNSLERKENKIVSKGQLLENKMNLCDNSRFSKQVTGASSTAFVVGDHTLLTSKLSAMKILNAGVDNYCVVFNFKSTTNRNEQISMNQENIFEIVDVKKHPNEDVALIYTRSDIGTHSKKFKLASDSSGMDIAYMLGYPNGLPLKMTNNIKTIPTNEKNFYGGFDAFSGNSGSPVFNNEHEVIGVLISGSFPDYNNHSKGDCIANYKTTNEDMKMETIVKTNYLKKWIKENTY